MNYLKYISIFVALYFLSMLSGCSQEGPDNIGNSEITAGSDATIPDVPLKITSWNGEKADDKELDDVGSNADIYHELTTFNRKVTIEFSGNKAIAESTDPDILLIVSGGYVTVDFQTENISGVEIIAKGRSDDGGLKIYGGSKFKLTLDGLTLKSNKGPAINSQCKKRMFLNLADGSRNMIEDKTDYSDDHYYRPGSSSFIEDRKGCFFSEGDLLVSGSGILEVKGKYRHGIAVDGYMVIRPGATIAVTEAARNCIHLKGDAVGEIGLWMKGGLLYCYTESQGGKCVKTDCNIRIDGGKMLLNSSGNSYFDSVDNDTSSPAGLKADSYISISNGDISICATGQGGKGINAGTTFSMSGGKVRVGCTGDKYIYNTAFTSSPKGVKATGDLQITGGDLKIASIGESDGSKGLESDGIITLTSCSADIYAYDDAINAQEVIINRGCHISACSINEDGIKGKKSVTIYGGNILSLGGEQGKGVDCDVEEGFEINGGKILTISGKQNSTPAPSSISYSSFGNVTGKVGEELTFLLPDNIIKSVKMPRSYSNAWMFYAEKEE